MDKSNVVLKVQNISKHYPGVVALDHVDFEVCAGEVHALVGANGAGKSTLIKILAGHTTPDEGEIILFGKTIHFRSPIESINAGIVTMPQEIDVAEDLTVYQNIFLGDEKKYVRFGFLNSVKMNNDAIDILNRIGSEINTKSTMRNLSVGDKQMIMIAHALSLKAKIMIFDEPTSALSHKETEALFLQIRKLKEAGVSIIYISHHMDEIFDIADRATILRDGCVVCTLKVDETNQRNVVKQMVGKEIAENSMHECHVCNNAILEIRGLKTLDKRVNGVSFCVNKGEVLGLYGITGAGRTEALKSVFTGKGILEGDVIFKGEKIKIKNPKHAINCGIAYAPESRKTEGLLLELSIKKNITLSILNRIAKFGFIMSKKETEITNKYQEALGIKTPSIEQSVKNLSGGNQQKVVLSKWLATDSDVVILDEPTVGIDVGAKSEIVSLIGEMARQGKATIVISSEIDELIKACDRILVMRVGKIQNEFLRDSFDKHQIMLAATGGEI